MPRDRHQNKDIERLLRVFEAHDWTVITTGSRYWPLRCPCGAHQTNVKCTPSGSRYLINLRLWGQRQPCWNKHDKEGQQ